MTGSGTLAIEAALIGRNIAPGTWRKFAFDDFDWFDSDLHDDLLEQAKSEVRTLDQPIWACDIDQSILEIAKLNANNAGVLQDIYFKQVAVKDFATDLENGVIIANPPYGKRLKEKKTAEELYVQMGEALSKYDDFSQYYLVGDPEFEQFFGKTARSEERRVGNECRTRRSSYNQQKKTYRPFTLLTPATIYAPNHRVTNTHY